MNILPNYQGTLYLIQVLIEKQNRREMSYLLSKLNSKISKHGTIKVIFLVINNTTILNDYVT